jgi:hypothetical protein
VHGLQPVTEHRDGSSGICLVGGVGAQGDEDACDEGHQVGDSDVVADGAGALGAGKEMTDLAAEAGGRGGQGGVGAGAAASERVDQITLGCGFGDEAFDEGQQGIGGIRPCSWTSTNTMSLGRTFRSIPSEVEPIVANLSLANMNFAEFADNADREGIFRGF